MINEAMEARDIIKSQTNEVSEGRLERERGER